MFTCKLERLLQFAQVWLFVFIQLLYAFVTYGPVILYRFCMSNVRADLALLQLTKSKLDYIIHLLFLSIFLSFFLSFSLSL